MLCILLMKVVSFLIHKILVKKYLQLVNNMQFKQIYIEEC